MHIKPKVLINNLYKLLCVCLLIALLSACSKHKQVETDVTKYAQRLSDFTKIPIEDVPSHHRLPRLNKASLKSIVPDITINLREFYAFNECPLNQLVATRNTALGKMHLPSSRFVYETQLIVALKRCINTVKQSDKNQSLRNKLKEWLSIKQDNLPLVWSNVITQSDEIIAHLSGSDDYISGQANDNLQATKLALSFLLASLDTLPAKSNLLETHLQELANAPLLARMWRTQHFLVAHLDNTSLLLDTFLRNNTCSTLAQEKQIDIMRNIFTNLFADKIQPLASELNRYHYQLMPILVKYHEHPHLPQNFKDYLVAQSVTGHSEYTNSMQRHIKLWQSIFSRCG